MAIGEFDKKAFGIRVRELRLRAKWSQDVLGQLLGHVNGCGISDYEKGQISPRVDVLIRLARALSVSTDYLLLGVDPPPVQAVISIRATPGAVRVVHEVGR